MTAYTIRELQQSESKALEEFLTLVFGESECQLARNYIDCMFSSYFRKPVFLVAVDGRERIMGAASYTEELFTVATWGVSWVAVGREYQGQGLGAALLRECESAILTNA